MASVNVFYSPELENPPMAAECSINFSFIAEVTGESTTVRIRDGLNQIEEDEWEKIQDKEYVRRLLALGALRVMEAAEVKETLDEADLKVSDEVSITDLKIADAVKVVASTHDLQKLEAWLTDEQRVPIRQALTRRINTLSGGD
jgi:hypothetical protein